MVDNIRYPPNPVEEMEISYFQTIRKNWESTAAGLKKINQKLSESLDYEDVSIVVAGSHGRLEASPSSDLDYMIISQREVEGKDEIVGSIQDLASEFGIGLPNPEGVFSDIVSIQDMTDRIGGRDDTIEYLAQRMLLLMESRPIYNERVYRNATDQILRKYLEYVIQEPEKEALFLMNDLIRYFRSICVNYQFNFWREQEKWALRNVKLRHSRIVLYGGLLFLILNASKEKRDKFAYLSPKIHLTPLEKIADVYADNGVASFDKILAAYEVFLRKVSDQGIRNSLKIDYEERYSNPHYMELKVSSDLLRTELTRFIFSMGVRGIWTDRVIEYLIF